MANKIVISRVLNNNAYGLQEWDTDIPGNRFEVPKLSYTYIQLFLATIHIFSALDYEGRTIDYRAN